MMLSNTVLAGRIKLLAIDLQQNRRTLHDCHTDFGSNHPVLHQALDRLDAMITDLHKLSDGLSQGKVKR